MSKPRATEIVLEDMNPEALDSLSAQLNLDQDQVQNFISIFTRYEIANKRRHLSADQLKELQESFGQELEKFLMQDEIYLKQKSNHFHIHNSDFEIDSQSEDSADESPQQEIVQEIPPLQPTVQSS